MVEIKSRDVELVAAETGFERSAYFTKDDPRGPEYGRFRMSQDVMGDYIVTRVHPDGTPSFTMRMQQESFSAWAKENT